jgi:hypothetical protein
MTQPFFFVANLTNALTRLRAGPGLVAAKDLSVTCPALPAERPPAPCDRTGRGKPWLEATAIKPDSEPVSQATVTRT